MVNYVQGILFEALISTVTFIFVILIFGALFSYLEHKNSKYIMSAFGYKGLMITGIVGTVVHELSHMIFCIIFRHKITDFSLFRPVQGGYDGIMGYVNHSWNMRSKYQKIGNVFIGLAPIIIGTTIVMLLIKIILPDGFYIIDKSISINMESINRFKDYNDIINSYISITISVFSSLNPFNQRNLLPYIVFIFLMYSITTHMDLSKEDLKNSGAGIWMFISIIFAINVVAASVGGTAKLLLVKIFLMTISMLTFAFSLAFIAFIIGFTIRSIINLFY